MRTRSYSRAAIALATAGVTQADVAAHMGVSKMAVSHWLAGRRRPPAELRAALERIVGPVNAAEVLTLIERQEEVMAA